MINEEGWIAVGICCFIVALFLAWLIKYNCGHICCHPKIDEPVNKITSYFPYS